MIKLIYWCLVSIVVTQAPYARYPVFRGDSRGVRPDFKRRWTTLSPVRLHSEQSTGDSRKQLVDGLSRVTPRQPSLSVRP